MIKLYTFGYIVKVNGATYLVKHGHLDDFVILFRPSVVIVSSTFTATIEWEHKLQWYKCI